MKHKVNVPTLKQHLEVIKRLKLAERTLDDIGAEFNKCKGVVYAALKVKNNSKLSHAIRARVIEVINYNPWKQEV